jgi:hypothetical protein
MGEMVAEPAGAVTPVGFFIGISGYQLENFSYGGLGWCADLFCQPNGFEALISDSGQGMHEAAA